MWVFSPHRVLQVSTYLPNPCQPSLGVKECMCHAWGLVSHPGCLPRVPGMGFGSTATLTENKAACLGRKNTERTLFFTRVFSGFREDKPRQKYDLAPFHALFSNGCHFYTWQRPRAPERRRCFCQRRFLSGAAGPRTRFK